MLKLEQIERISLALAVGSANSRDTDNETWGVQKWESLYRMYKRASKLLFMTIIAIIHNSDVTIGDKSKCEICKEIVDNFDEVIDGFVIVIHFVLY